MPRTYKEILKDVRAYESKAISELCENDYHAYLEERIADAAGWEMVLEEADAERE